MSKLKKWTDRGWMFCVWISQNSGFIIQGKLGIDDEDMDFDVQSPFFNEALDQAILEIERITSR